MSRGRATDHLPNKQFRVRVDGYCDFECEAKTASQARWKAFRAAREAGYFSRGFGSFLHACGSVFEVRQ
jgi:hypothetical protein